MGVSTLGLSEAIRPALSKTWQNNLDGAGTLGVAPAMDYMNKATATSPYTIQPTPSTKAKTVAASSSQSSNNPVTNISAVAA